MTEAGMEKSSPTQAASLARRLALDYVALAQRVNDKNPRLVPTLDLIAEDLLQLSCHLSLLGGALNPSCERLAKRPHPS